MATTTAVYMLVAAAPAPAPAAPAPAPVPVPAPAPVPPTAASAVLNDENTPITAAGQAPAGQPAVAAPMPPAPGANPVARPPLQALNGRDRLDPLDIILYVAAEPGVTVFPFIAPRAMERAQIVGNDQLVWM